MPLNSLRINGSPEFLGIRLAVQRAVRSWRVSFYAILLKAGPLEEWMRLTEPARRIRWLMYALWHHSCQNASTRRP